MRFLIAFLLGTLFASVASNSDMDCVNAIMNSIANTDQLQSMLLNSGKGINDLGNIDACDANPNTKYVVFKVAGPFIRIGLCLPKKCNQENMEIIRAAIESLFMRSEKSGSMCQTSIPSEEKPTVAVGNIIGFIFFGALFLTCILGMIVEYTNLFGEQKCNEYESLSEAAKDKELIKSKRLIGKFFLAFSFSRNLRKLFFTPQNDKDYLAVLNGVRVISMAYVVLGHTNGFLIFQPMLNVLNFNSFMQSFYAVFVSGGYYSVDVFFFMSAFLGTYLMIQKFDGKKFGLSNFPLIYFHRYFRLAPPILLLLCFVMTFYLYLGYGPIWMYVNAKFIEPCHKYWWTTITFINNMYPGPDDIDCYGILWYLANDMQFFMILPFLVLVYLRNKFAGYMVIYFLLLSNIVCTFLVSIIGHHPMTVNIDSDKTHIYHVPYTRIGAYLVGVILGVYYFEYMKSKRDPSYKRTNGCKLYSTIESNRSIRWGLYVISSILMIFMICSPYIETHNYPNRNVGDIPSAFFNCLHRIVFVLSFGLWMAGPATGRSYLFRIIFGGSAWAPWAKMSFMTYLIHSFLILYYIFSAQQGIYFTERWALYLYFSLLVLSTLLSIPFSLMFECPFLQIERLLLFPEKTSMNKENKIGYNDKEIKSFVSEDREEARSLLKQKKINETIDESELKSNISKRSNFCNE